jgi:glycerate kinase
VVREDGRMHVLVAPEAFAGSLTAAQAAVAIADGWSRRAPGDRLTLRPMTDGGPGFVDTLSETLDGQLVAVTVRGPMGDHTPAGVLMVGSTAYVEAAQACGPHLVAGGHDPERASTYGVGELIDSARAAGANRIVVGTGGVVANDGGAGALAALGATGDVPLDRGPAGLAGVATVDPSAAVERLQGVQVVVATDVDVPLLGLFGTTKAHADERGLGAEKVQRVDAWLDAFVVATLGAAPAQRRPADEPGAGAGGGLGFALGCLGASRSPALEQVADLIGLPDLAGRCDLVVTGEGAYDFSSRSGSVVHHVAQVAQEALRPCVVLAGQVLVGAREMRAMGVESAYAVVDAVDSTRAHDDPAGSLAALAERVARTWSRLPG